MKKLFLAALLLIQTACVSYQYIEPEDEKGRICTKSCLDRQWNCSSDCSKNHTNCLAASNIQINLGGPKTNDNREIICNNAHNDCEYQCKHYYNNCYRSCGGQIIRTE